MPEQRDELLSTCSKLLDSQGKSGIICRMMPGVRFTTSDIGISSAKVSALLIGNGYSIHIGDCINIDHRNKKTVADFDKALDQLFAQYEDGIRRLEELEKTVLSYPINAMTRICKNLCMRQPYINLKARSINRLLSIFNALITQCLTDLLYIRQ